MNNVKAGSLDPKTRVRHGLIRERQIATALRDQIGLPIRESTEYQDKERKIDRWIAYPDGQVALQIKYRESGEDLLFEVCDKWFGWDDHRNKLGRDMFGDAKEYAVLLQDRKTIVMVPAELGKTTTMEMYEFARQHGWTRTGAKGSTLDFWKIGLKLQLKVQRDPGDGRQKMVAYIPATFFVAVAQAKVYSVKLPPEWRF